MFEKGDIVYCIDVEGVDDLVCLDKEYIVDSVFDANTIRSHIPNGNDSIVDKGMLLLQGVNGAFILSRFVSLMQYRKLKIEKCLKRETL